MNASRLTSRLATALTVAGAGFIGYIGFRYLTDPQDMAPGFGMRVAPAGEAADFLNVKGVRDIASGLVPLALLAAGQRRSAGIAMLVTALIPTGDMLTILRHDGSTPTALGVHGVTAALVAATGLLLLNERTPQTRTATA
ncbi:DUF4267 domain-containing protein [Nocardia yunnanensis]|uniref:DUF4267 domain-containing protein n=1 Tax=Nocardia yunnanensis TaxID=2382165 RepID=A0A386Z4F1_9NOCA|nr:DUF4267 domain-containing protein [Nocardia yunnanensis]AYF72648.1 DUF4267 domain-containing protein [Nocardia yunnanensis]